jgi:hypothetical protein
MVVNWARVYNRLWEIINPADQTHPVYFSGGRFISAVREVDPYFPNYAQYMDQRKTSGKSTSRRDYFYDILLSLPEPHRFELVQRILELIQPEALEKVSEIRNELGGLAAVPAPQISEGAWNARRLTGYLRDIDGRIAERNYEGALTLTYTCLEGFLKAFLHERLPTNEVPNELIDLARTVRTELRGSISQYPDEALAMLTHIAHTIDKSRNQFSESHFDQQANRWLAVFARDLVNSEIRLLLHFMKQGVPNEST